MSATYTVDWLISNIASLVFECISSSCATIAQSGRCGAGGIGSIHTEPWDKCRKNSPLRRLEIRWIFPYKNQHVYSTRRPISRKKTPSVLLALRLCQHSSCTHRQNDYQHVGFSFWGREKPQTINGAMFFGLPFGLVTEFLKTPATSLGPTQPKSQRRHCSQGL